MKSDDLRAALSDAPEALLHGIDRGIEAHLAWTQRLLRCALLHESPGGEVLRPDAHAHCQFGIWFSNHRKALDTFEEALVERVAQSHQRMHEAVRAMCNEVLQGRAASAADLQAFEQEQSAMVTSLNELRKRVADAETHRDILTGLPLRHGLEYAFRLRQMDARRGHSKLWLAMIDVDHFKAVNDSHGHAVGDVTLRHISRCLVECLRETDALFRFGGEEFLGLFLVREVRGVDFLATRLLESVGAAPLTPAVGITLYPTVTVGLARVGANEDLVSATERADQAMLLGKTQGRGRFVLAPD